MNDEFYRLLASRRMWRAYLEREVPREKVERVLDAARKSPSAGHSQGVRFGVVSAQEKRSRIARALGEERFLGKGLPPWLSGAPVHILAGVSSEAYRERYAEPDKTTGPDRWPVPYEILDAGKALMALYLAAESEGLGCGYLGPHVAAPALLELPWPSDWTFVGLITLGYPDRSRQPRSFSHKRGWRPFEETVRWWDEEL